MSTKQETDARAKRLLPIMKTREGRAFIWEQLGEAGTFQTTFDRDPGQMAFNEGRRSMGNSLLVRIHQFCPALYNEMVREAQEDEEIERSRTDNRNRRNRDD